MTGTSTYGDMEVLCIAVLVWGLNGYYVGSYSYRISGRPAFFPEPQQECIPDHRTKIKVKTVELKIKVDLLSPVFLRAHLELTLVDMDPYDNCLQHAQENCFWK